MTDTANLDEHLGATQVAKWGPRGSEEVPCSMIKQQAGGGLENAGSLASHFIEY